MRRLIAFIIFAVTLSVFQAPQAVSAKSLQPQVVQQVEIPAVPQVQNTCNYTVKPGDVLSRISPFHWQYIHVPSGNPNLIFPGQVIDLCPSGNPPPTTPIFGPVHFVDSGGPNGTSCHDPLVFQNVSQWAIVPGCYGGIYPGVYWNGSADCFAYVQYLHHGTVPYMHAHNYPIVGAVVHIAPGVQGAGSAGHYVQILAISGGTFIAAEQNMYWRGGGWDRISFRYMYFSSGMTYLW